MLINVYRPFLNKINININILLLLLQRHIGELVVLFQEITEVQKHESPTQFLHSFLKKLSFVKLVLQYWNEVFFSVLCASQTC